MQTITQLRLVVQISLSDVATKAGVSTATVSRVLNGKELARIPASTQERVRAAAVALNYHPNRFARGLQSRRTMNIGVLVDGLRNPFFAELLDTLEEMIVAAGYDVLPDTGRRAANSDGSGLRGWPVDGVLMWAVGDMSIEMGGAAGELPVVYMGYPRSDGADFVCHDAAQGSRDALQHLWDKGHRRIAFVSTATHDARCDTYAAFCQERGIRPEYLAIDQGASAGEADQSAYRKGGFKVGQWLGEMPAGSRPTAVFCYNDLIALGLMSGAASCGLSIPGDLAIVGFDGIDEGLYRARSLTTAEIPAKQLCGIALETLLRRLENDLPEEPRQVVLPMRLRAGTST
ncbi:MAG TPA: LacI family DNA-binding transcriptional regulator [Capsulimonadaceae bacterium]